VRELRIIELLVAFGARFVLSVGIVELVGPLGYTFFDGVAIASAFLLLLSSGSWSSSRFVLHKSPRA
jgi:hypothetical protein